jgi:hypothetical protein
MAHVKIKIICDIAGANHRRQTGTPITTKDRPLHRSMTWLRLGQTKQVRERSLRRSSAR